MPAHTLISNAHDPFHAEAVAAILARPLPAFLGRPGAAVADLAPDPAFLYTLADRELVNAFRAANRAIADVGIPAATAPREGVIDPETAGSSSLEIIESRDHQQRVEPLRGNSHHVLGECPPEAHHSIHLQLSRGDHFIGPGSGDALDMALSVLRAASDIPARVCVPRRFAGPLSEALVAAPRSAPVTLVLIDGVCTPWARDNAIGARVGDEPALILPARSSRNDLPGEFVEADDEAGAARAHGVRALRSELLFQGGNIIVTRDPRDYTRRLALIGEAELVRNAGRGGRDAVIADFRELLAVDDALVLPNPSFHIDYDVSVAAATGGRETIAFVNDEETASTLVALDAIDRLSSSAVPVPELRALARDMKPLIARRDFLSFGMAAAGLIRGGTGQDGLIDAGFVRHLTAGVRDPRQQVADTQRVLASFDRLSAGASAVLTQESLGFAYLRALARLRERRRETAALLAARGFKVVAIPSVSDEGASINAINMLHLPGGVLVPGVAGVGARITEAAKSAILKRLPGTKVSVVSSDEAQRRQGSVRCSVGIL